MAWVVLVAGIVVAAAGGELFVRGVVGAARRLGVSPGVVAATFAAFATSSPELTVSVTSALAGAPQIALGDALGSNVVNVALILGAAAAISAMPVTRDALKRDFPVALAVPVLTAVAFADGRLSRIEAALMLAAFAAWLAAVAHEAARQRRASAPVPRGGGGVVALQCAGGLVALVLAAQMIVEGATTVAAALGIAPFVIGATLVALGTSAPEIATAIVAKLRGHDEVGIGAILGSNIFNGLFIVGVAGAITPIAMGLASLAVALGFGLAAMAVVFPPQGGVITRRRGVLLLVLYAAYLGSLVTAQGVPE